jgi:putative peptide zinc metalloprotease protein
MAWPEAESIYADGIAAFLYRLTLLISIAAVIAAKVFLLGLVFAAVYIGTSVLGAIRALMQYLWHAKETEPVRLRAVTLGVLLLVVIPTLLLIVPIPSSVHAAGVVAAEQETVLRTRTPGFLQAVPVERGVKVTVGTPIAELANDAALEAVAEQSARVLSSRLRRDAFRAVDPVKALQEEAEGKAFDSALE